MRAILCKGVISGALAVFAHRTMTIEKVSSCEAEKQAFPVGTSKEGMGNERGIIKACDAARARKGSHSGVRKVDWYVCAHPSDKRRVHGCGGQGV